jgi:uncharacterized membrane protein YukC
MKKVGIIIAASVLVVVSVTFFLFGKKKKDKAVGDMIGI